MNDHDSVIGPEFRALQRALPGAIVFVAVLVLLRGFEGTTDALKLQISTFAGSFLGGGKELARVLLHTMPLALAAAIAAFAIASRWLKFEGLGSIVVLAGIVIAGAATGGFLRGFGPRPPHAESIPLLIAGNTAAPVDAQQQGRTEVDPLRRSVRVSILPAAPENPIIKQPTLQRLREIEWFAEPNLKNAPPANISPLGLFPKAAGLLGFVLAAVDQLLGYLVAYQPRLFLAAILAGGWVGWSWQRRLTRWCERVTECAEEVIGNETRNAA